MYVGIRHMHREHFIFSIPTCAQRAPFVEDTFNLVFTCAGGMQELPNPPETRRRQP